MIFNFSHLLELDIDPNICMGNDGASIARTKFKKRLAKAQNFSTKNNSKWV